MSDGENPPQAQDGSLDRLMTYTTFHVGMYATIAAAVVWYMAEHSPPFWVNVLLWIGVGFLLAAGVAGGVIAGNLSHYASYTSFVKAPLTSRLIRPLSGQWTYSTWSLIEHFAFWAGVAFISLTLLLWILTRPVDVPAAARPTAPAPAPASAPASSAPAPPPTAKEPGTKPEKATPPADKP